MARTREPDRRRASGPLGLPARARRDRPGAAARAVAAAAGLDRPRGRRHARLTRPTDDRWYAVPPVPGVSDRRVADWVHQRSSVASRIGHEAGSGLGIPSPAGETRGVRIPRALAAGLTAGLLVGACTSSGPTDDRGGGTTGPGPTAYASSSTTAPPVTTAPPTTPSPTPLDEPPKPAPDPASIEALIATRYEGGNLTLGREGGSTDAYRQYFVTYESNGLTISGRINIPRGAGPFPAVVLAHGYVDPAVYTNGETMLRERDHLARHGYVTLHIDYRNHAQSDKDPNNDANLRAGYTVDAINAGLALKQARFVDPSRLALIGRSMGGGVVYTALVVRPGLFRAAVAYAPVSSDSIDNFDKWVRRDASRSGAARAVIGAARHPGGQPGRMGGDEPAHLLRPHHRAAPHPPRHGRRGLPAGVVAGVGRSPPGQGQVGRSGDLSRRAPHADLTAVGHLDPAHRGLPRPLTSGEAEQPGAVVPQHGSHPVVAETQARAARRSGGRRGRGCSGSPSRARPGRAGRRGGRRSRPGRARTGCVKSVPLIVVSRWTPANSSARSANSWYSGMPRWAMTRTRSGWRRSTSRTRLGPGVGAADGRRAGVERRRAPAPPRAAAQAGSRRSSSGVKSPTWTCILNRRAPVVERRAPPGHRRRARGRRSRSARRRARAGRSRRTSR